MPSVDEAVAAAAEQYSNWGKWGPDDELGTLNYITPEKVSRAGGLARQGKVFSLAIPFDANGPQSGSGGRTNPLHYFIATGTDMVGQEFPHGFGYADDCVTMPLQCATQWDGLSHVYYQGKMWNGYEAAEVSSRGANRNGIQHFRNRIVSRGVLLDVARSKGHDHLEPGYAISEQDLTACAEGEGVAIGTGDIVLVRTGQMGYCRANGWGSYAGGDAPGLSFHTAGWLHRTEIAALATDTWGVEVRPNEWEGAVQPLHCIMIPMIGLLVGEIFDLEELAADCAADQVYEFLFVAPPLPITGAVGSPVNPQAIK